MSDKLRRLKERIRELERRIGITKKYKEDIIKKKYRNYYFNTEKERLVILNIMKK